jgi:uncharacterized membrane protein
MNTPGYAIASAMIALFAATGCGGEDMKSDKDEDASAAQNLVKCEGINECRGQSECASEGANSCEGQNECKGHGFITVPEAECDEKGGKVLES